MDRSKKLAKLLAFSSVDEMLFDAFRHNLIADGKIDFTDARARFDHEGLDLRNFKLEGADLSGSRFVNCSAAGVVFDRCTFVNVEIVSRRAFKADFSRASFRGAKFSDAHLGPRTLNLADADFTGAKLSNVTFVYGSLERADFSNAILRDVFFRGANLKSASFREASLSRVSFESATLVGTDFTGAALLAMEMWGEPDFDGAVIEDEQRYQFGIVQNAAETLDELVRRQYFDPSELPEVLAFREYAGEFLSSAPEVMLVGAQYAEFINPSLFAKMLRAMKHPHVH